MNFYTVFRGQSNILRWALLISICILTYASLHPIEALRLTEANPFAYWALSKYTWQGYRPYGVSLGDVVSNILAYSPIGFFIARIVRQKQQCVVALAIACAAAACLSISLEALQTFNPYRVPSLWDVVINVVGALLGAVFGYIIPIQSWSLLGFQRLNRFTLFSPHAGAIWGVIGLWLLAQSYPQTWVFVTAPINVLVDTQLPKIGLIEAHTAVLDKVETMVALLAMLCFLGMVRIGSQFLNRHFLLRFSWMVLAWCLMLLAQLSVYLIEFGWASFLAPWGDGVWLACWLALIFALIYALIPTPLCVMMTVAVLGAYFAVVQLLPPHPYTNQPNVLQMSQFTHVFGLTAAISALWPVFALIALVLQLRYVRSKSSQS